MGDGKYTFHTTQAILFYIRSEGEAEKYLSHSSEVQAH